MGYFNRAFGQAEEVALPDVGVSLSYNARNSIVTNLNFFLGQKSEVVAIQSLQHPLLALGGFFYFCSIGSTSPSQRKKT